MGEKHKKKEITIFFTANNSLLLKSNHMNNAIISII